VIIIKLHNRERRKHIIERAKKEIKKRKEMRGKEN